jgi:hypothetical protein
MKTQTSVFTGRAVDEIPALAKEPMNEVMRGTAKDTLPDAQQVFGDDRHLGPDR